MDEMEVPSEILIQLLTPAEAPSEGHDEPEDFWKMLCESLDMDITETEPDKEFEAFLKEFGCSEGMPPCGEVTECDCIREVSPSCQDISLMDDKLLPFELQLRVLIGKADVLQSGLRQGHSEKEFSTDTVRNLLHIAKPYFTNLESTARSRTPHLTPPPTYICSRLLDFSQQLCMRLEQLVLHCAFNNILSLDQTEPDSLFHFYIGQCQIDRVTVSMFRYCGPVPYEYDARADTGMYKRMRWNVERPRDNQLLQTDPDHQGEATENSDPEYFFLCYEDTPELRTETNGDEMVATGGVVRTWTIGQWIQTHPNPETETIDDWYMYLCEVPQGRYHKLLCLDCEEEPSTDHATNCLLAELFKQTAEENSCTVLQTAHEMT